MRVQRKVEGEDARFGDNYYQSITFGINPTAGTVTLSWPVIDLATMQELLTFFEGQRAEPFLYTLPGDIAERTWMCRTWTWGQEGGSVMSFEAQLSERFDRS